MCTQTTSTQETSEILIRRREPWWRSLWVQIPVIVLVLWVVTGIYFWWNCRSAWAVFRVNGLASVARASPLQSLFPNSGLARYIDHAHIQDREVASVLLHNTAVDDQWLVRFRRFRKLAWAAFDGGQIGPGLQNLSELPQLKMIIVAGKQRTVVRGWTDHVNSSISARHFLLVPQLESLALNGFEGTISDAGQLKHHPHLHTVALNEISDLSRVLRQFEVCENIKSLTVQQKEGLDEESLASICWMTHLETLNINVTNETVETDLDSRLKNCLPTTSINVRR